MTRNIISNIESKYNISISDVLTDDIISVFGEESNNKIDIESFITQELTLEHVDYEKFKSHFLKQRLITIIIFYIVQWLLWILFYHLGFRANFSEIIHYLTQGSLFIPTLLIEFLFYYKQDFSDNKISLLDSKKELKTALFQFIVLAIPLLILNIATFYYFPWSIYAITGITGFFSIHYSKVTFYHKYS